MSCSGRTKQLLFQLIQNRTMTNQKVIDSPSYAGQFGWERIGSEDFAIPVIVRCTAVRYSPVRVVEQEIIKKYDSLPQTVFQCITLKSFYLTSCEAKLLNDINFNHCNNRYGETFFTTKDVIISSSDVKELSRYLNVSHEIYSKDISAVSANFGIIKVMIDPDKQNGFLLVPYLTKSCRGKVMRFVPSKLIEQFATTTSTSVRSTPNDWDIMYLKMLCIYCENNSQQYITRDSQILLLDGLVYIKTAAPLSCLDYTTGTPLQNNT